jgi:hypothetical protein
VLNTSYIIALMEWIAWILTESQTFALLLHGKRSLGRPLKIWSETITGLLP